MNAAEVLVVATSAGVTLEAAPDGLRYTAPHGLPPGLRDLLREHKGAILAYLAETATAETAPPDVAKPEPQAAEPAKQALPEAGEAAIPGDPDPVTSPQTQAISPNCGHPTETVPNLKVAPEKAAVVAVPLPPRPTRPAGRLRRWTDHGYTSETVSGGELCQRCGRSVWDLTVVGAWLCRCGAYWSGRQERPVGWPDRWPDPVPGPDGGCCRCGRRVYRRRGAVEECMACRPPDGPIEHPCVGGCGEELPEGVLFCPTCWEERRGAYAPQDDETGKRACKHAGGHVSRETCGHARGGER